MCRIFTKYAGGLLLLAMLCWAGAASAQLPFRASSQFTITGILQDATLGTAPTGINPAFAGGTLTVNGHKIIVPANTIVQYPANSSTWVQMFAQAPAPYGMSAVRAGAAVPESGMAMADEPQPLATWEVNVVGNRVVDPVSHVSRYIAALITFSQEALNAHQGFINYIDYAKGEMRVGGELNDKYTGTRVRINDPTGKFGMAHSPDPRFTLDPDNPTVRSQTGYPMGLPRWSPTNPGPHGEIDDPVRPSTQRPKDALGNPLATINMPPVANIVAGSPDSRLQSPFMVGDYISYSGTLVSDSTGTAGPNPGAASTYISAHTVIDNVAIYTAPGDNPAYVAIDVTIVGTGGITLAGVQEATARTRFEGFSTDPTRNVYLFGVDLDPITGATSERDWGSINVDPGPPTGAARGRWRFRPPPPKVLTMPSAGMFDPPTREVRAVIATFHSAFAGDLAWTNAAWQAGPTDANGMYPNGQFALPLVANGLISGQYHAPISQYLFPEQILGNPIPPMNFETFRWLAQGGQSDSVSGLIAGQLNPWPGDVVPAQVQTPPLVSAGSNQAVTSASPVTLTGTVNAADAYTVAWTQQSVQQPDGTVGLGAPVTLNSSTSLTPTFTAPTVTTAAPVVLSFKLTVTTSSGATASSLVTVTVSRVKDIVAITGVNQLAGKQKLTVTATASPNNGSAILTMTTVGGRDGLGNPADVSVKMSFANGVYTAGVIGPGFNATSVIVTSNGGGSATMFNTDLLWKIK